MRRSETLSMEAGKTVKQEGKDNNLLELIAADPAFNLTLEELQAYHGTCKIRRTRTDSGREVPCKMWYSQCLMPIRQNLA